MNTKSKEIKKISTYIEDNRTGFKRFNFESSILDIRVYFELSFNKNPELFFIQLEQTTGSNTININFDTFESVLKYLMGGEY